MRMTMIAALALVLGASAARAQGLADLTAATGINNTVDANGANNAMKMRDTITRKLQQSSGTSSPTGKGGWEEADAGHDGGGGRASASGKSGGWASNHGTQTTSGWASRSKGVTRRR